MIILNRVVRLVVTEVEFKQRSERVGISHAFQRGTSQCKGLMAEACISCSRKSMKSRVTEPE